MVEIWDSINFQLERSGFVPTERLIENSTPAALNRRNPENGPVTLFEAVRLACGVSWADIESADCTYWNWLELRVGWKELWTALDEATANICGKPSTAIPWAFTKDRTSSEVQGLISEAARVAPKLRVPSPNRRPDARFMTTGGKILSALANTLGVISINCNRSYGDLIKSLPADVSHDEELLCYLDELVSNSNCELDLQDQVSLIPRQLVRAKVEFFRNSESTSTFCDFLAHLKTTKENDLSDDKRLQSLLLLIAPETSEVVNKALLKEEQSHP